MLKISIHENNYSVYCITKYGIEYIYSDHHIETVPHCSAGELLQPKYASLCWRIYALVRDKAGYKEA